MLLDDRLFQALLNRIRFYDKVEIKYDSYEKLYTIYVPLLKENAFRGSEHSLIEWLGK